MTVHATLPETLASRPEADTIADDPDRTVDYGGDDAHRFAETWSTGSQATTTLRGPRNPSRPAERKVARRARELSDS